MSTESLFNDRPVTGRSMINDRLVVGRVVNNNGEIVNELRQGDRMSVLRSNSIDYLNSTVELNKNKPYVKAYTKPLFALSRILTGTECQFANYLMQYISYNTGILAHENGRKLTRNYMVQETGLSLKTIDRILCSLVEKRVLGKHKTGRDICFTANPYIFMRGSRVNSTLAKLFENSKWASL